MAVVKKIKPKTKRELRALIKSYLEVKGQTNLNDIDTSLITDMSSLFEGVRIEFDVSEWNTENVVNMEGMFLGCTKFNSDISKWNVGKVRNMSFMFDNCSSFNQDLGNWDTRNVKNMSWMFCDCSLFNQDLSKWSIRKVRNTVGMFYFCFIKEGRRPKYYYLYT